MTITTAASTARPANSSAMLTGDAQITRNARRMIFPGNASFLRMYCTLLYSGFLNLSGYVHGSSLRNMNLLPAKLLFFPR